MSAAAAEGVALLEWVPGCFLRVRVIAVVETRSQFGIAKYFICFVDAGHLLLSILLGNTLLSSLVRVEDLGLFAVGRLDLAFVGIVFDTKDLVVVLCFAALQSDMSLVKDGVDLVFLIRTKFSGFL
ncbi:hypothetical protein HG531_010569 [Fusarium graminearum]|nr:hypothetical protein HG531_010569 [Fusarium graminearum]